MTKNLMIIADYCQCSRFQRKSNRLTDAAHEAYALYRKSNNRNNLDSAIQGFQAVIDRYPAGHPSRAAALSNLAYVILHAFTKDIPVDIERAISLFRSALALRPPGHPDHPISILYLCKALHQRHLHRRDRADLREAAKLYHSLLPLCVEGSYLQLHAIEECNALARDPSDESIMLRRTVVGYCQPRHEYRSRSLNRLAGDLYARFQRNGDLSHIHEAVNLSREALDECPADSERSFFLSVLAYTLKLRFHHLRNPSDIKECISLNREALSLRPPRHPARRISLNNLAKALEASYICYGNITEFQEAVQLDEAAYDVSSGYFGTPPPQSQHGEEYDDLGMCQLTCTPEPEEGEDQPAKSVSSNHQVRALLLNCVAALLMNCHRPGHRQEMLSSLVKAAQEKVQSSMR
jgi:tetratricopeptide (TPR) repeat protein